MSPPSNHRTIGRLAVVAGGSRGEPRRDIAVAATLFAAFAGLYWTTRQPWLVQDGPGLLDGLLYDDPRYWMHFAILPVARWLRACLPGLEPFDALALVSVIGAAAGVAFTYAFCRRLRATRLSSAVAAALCGLSPACWFQGTLVEVHALHFGAVALSAWVTVSLPWPRTWVSLLALAALIPLVEWTHRTGPLLLPGWVALAWMARSEQVAGSGWRFAAAAATACGLGLLAAMALCSLCSNGAGISASLSHDLSIVSSFGRRANLEYLRSEWLAPLGLLGLWGFCGLLFGLRRDLAVLVLAGLLLPSLLFFAWWSEPTRGGYALGSICFLAALATRLPIPGGTRGAALGTVVVAAQFAWGWHALPAYPDAQAIIERARHRAAVFARALGGEGSVITFDPTLQLAQQWDVRVREHNLLHDLAAAALHGEPPGEVSKRFLQAADAYRSSGLGALGLGLGLQKEFEPALRPYLDALSEACRAKFDCRLAPDDRWPVLILAAGPPSSW